MSGPAHFVATLLFPTLLLTTLLAAPRSVQAQCSGPLLAPTDVECEIGKPCSVPLLLTQSGDVASAAATLGTSAACDATCEAGAAAPGASCTVNDAACRFNVADLSAPITAFASGAIAHLTLTCTQEGTEVLTLGNVSFGNTAGQPVPGCTATATLTCRPSMLCFGAAEGGGVLTGAMISDTQFTAGADDDPQADSLSAALVFPNSTKNSFNGGSNDKVTYTIDLPSAGTWNLWGRFYYPGAPGSNDANSFLVQVDGGSRKKLGNNLNSFQIWHWDGEGDIETDAHAPLSLGSLSAGQHELLIEKREVTPVPPRLDAICLTKETTPPPDAVACAAIPSCAPPASTTTLPTTTTTPVTSTTIGSATTTTITSTTIGSATTTTITTTTIGSGTTTTLPPPDDVLCFEAGGNDPAGVFNGAMTTGTAFTGGNDLDPAADNLSSPLVFANSTSSASGGNADRVSYSVDLPSSGPWYLWGRFYYPDAPGSNGGNSFLARIDSASRQKFGNHLNFFRTWHWDGDGEIETGARVGLALGTLAAGPHMLTIEKREVLPTPPRIDLICLTKDGSTPPTDALACGALGGCP